MFKKMKRDRVFQQVSGEIKRQIYNGSLKPGDRLPPEKDLAEHFSVSRQTIRESMRVLEMSGFISIHRGGGGGPVIENTVASRVSEGLAEAIHVGPTTLEDLINAWRDIEKIVLRQVIKFANEKDFEKFRNNISKAKSKLNANTPIFQEGRRFHEILSEASKNSIFKIVLNAVLVVYMEFHSRLDPDYDAAVKILNLQENVVNAILKRNQDVAVKYLDEYFDFIKERFESVELLNGAV